MYHGGHAGPITQLLLLGDNMLSLGADNKLAVWSLGEYDAPRSVIPLPVSQPGLPRVAGRSGVHTRRHGLLSTYPRILCLACPKCGYISHED